MAVESASAPSWLFSFVDLAFLLLIAMTQVADPNAPELGEIVIPRLDEESSEQLPTAAAEAWQVRVHPTASLEDAPFELLRAADGRTESLDRVTEPELRQRLAGLKERGGSKPLLAPHADSRSQHLLDAAAAIESQWPKRRRVLIGHRSPGP